MNETYKNSAEIVTFLNRAQNKIANLTPSIVKDNSLDSIALSLEIIEFIESLDNEWCDWKEDEIISMIEYFNEKAALNTIPFLQIVGYQSNVLVSGSTQTSTTIRSVNDIPDYISETNKIIAKTVHNKLADLQGGNETERYHLTAEQYKRLLALIMVEPKAAISLLSSIPNSIGGLFEKGTSVTSFRVQGSVTLNDGGKHSKSVYQVAGVDAKTYEGTDVGLEYAHMTAITDTTIVKFLAYFTDASMKEASLELKFEYPYYSGLDTAGKAFADITKNKFLIPKASQVNVPFEIPAGNASSSTPVYPYVFFPESWGLVKNVGANDSFMFDYINSFTRSLIVVTLPDGTSANYNKYEYQTATQGNMTFNFKF